MMRKPCELYKSSCAVFTLGEHNAENACRLHGIFTKRFVEVAHAKQQQRIRVFHLDAVVLLHERGFYNRGCFFFVDSTHGNFVDLKGIKSKTAATFL